MHLLRVQVPEFRALKNVDIQFEKDFIRKVFPLGSQNGGGKSTLLQLIFVLLHCSTDSDRLPFLKNLLAQVSIPEGKSHKVLAKMDIWDGEKVVQIEFLCCNDTFLEPFKSNGTTAIDIATIGDYSIVSLLKEQCIKQKLNKIEANISRLHKTAIQEYEIMEEDAEFSTDELMQLDEELKKKKQEYADVHPIAENLMEFLKLEKLLRITSTERQSLFCRITGMEASEILSFLQKLADNIFLAAPSTQVYHFLSFRDRTLLFKTETEDSSYEEALKQSKTKLPGFFTYDIISTEAITESFKVARDQDFAEVMNTGQYGNHYQQLLKEMNNLLATGKRISPQLRPTGKRISPQLRPIGVNIRGKKAGVEGIRFQTEEGIELYPEDLSHGELKRLSIYAWLKHCQIADAIVLMDEVENAFHPDWQYQIVLDLMEWGPTNQYILATHSYELCQALTPGHVKELEPKLLPVR